MVGFIFGGNTGVKASDLQSRRAAISDREVIAKTLAERMKRKPRNLGEGVGYLADSIASAYTMNKLKGERAALDKDVATGRDEAWSRIIAAMAGGGAAGAPGAPETPPPPAGASVSGDGGAFYKLLDAKEGGGEYGTLFNFANRPGGKFADVDITGMTLDELSAFTDPSGPYGQYVAGLNNGTVATPLGRGQIVGSTLRDAAAEMGLPGDTKFTPEIQDKIIAHLARRRLRPDMSQAEKRAALAAEWAGFKNASPADLDAAIAEIEGGGMAPAMADPMAGSAGGATPPPAGGMSPRVAALIEAAGSEYLTPEQRQVVNALLAQEMAKGQPMDPYKAAQLEMDRARLAEDRRVADAKLALDREKMAAEGMEAPKTITRKREDGSEVVMQWDRKSGTYVPLDAPAGASAPDVAGKLTESEARVVRFKSMQEEVAPVLDEIETIWDPANIPDALARQSPIAPNWFQSEPGQMYEAAASQWVEGALRLATGAAATPPEFDRTMGAYFARVGDTPATIEFKRRMRAAYTRTLERSLGSKGEVEPGTLELPEDFRRRYMKDNPPPAGTAAGAPADAAPTGGDAGDVPQKFLDEGYDASTWKYLDPEQRKLWE